MIFEYTITMKWVNTTDEEKGTIESFDIAPQSINQLTMFNDYESTNMPVIYCTLTLDKSYIDKIIKGAKSAFIYLNIFKVYTPNDTGVEIKQLTQYSGKMNYFINQDINYNKELDYSGTNKDKKDVLQTFSLGLMFNTCIEENKQTVNTTLNQTTMMNAVYYFLQQAPLLIEPFEYNDKLDQLIVPPMDSLSKVIDYFNNIKVFYSTPYRFYMDPDCTYLMSTSGKGIQRKDEKYNTCFFNVRGINEKESFNEGIIEKPKIGAYYTDINVKDSYYTVDSDTNKLYNEILTIIDPSISESKALLGTINSAVSIITNLVNKVTSTVTKYTDTVKVIPTQLTIFRTQISSAASNIDGVLNLNNGLKEAIRDGLYGVYTNSGLNYNSTHSANDRFNEAIDKARLLKDLYIWYEETSTDSGSGDSESSGTTKSIAVRGEKIVKNETIDEYIKKLNSYKASANEKNNNYSLKMPSSFTEAQNLLINLSNNYANFTSYFNGITATSISKNLSGITKKVVDNKAKVAQATQLTNEMREKINQSLLISGYLSAASEIIKELEELYDYWANTTNEEVDDCWKKPYVTLNSDKKAINPFSDMKTDMNLSSKIVEEETNRMLNSIEGYTMYTNKVSTLVNNLEPTIKQLKSFCINSYKDIKTTALSDYKKTIADAMTAWNSLSALGATAKTQLSQMTKSAKEAENKIKAMNFSINSLKDIQSNLDSFKDLSNIGLLGISQFKANLNINDLKATSTGTKIVRMSNDNANAAKNIKANIENHLNQLSITKTNIDTTVFTPNKRYVVKNYDAHGNKDGLFILNKKSDIFLRHTNDKFTISTQLELSRVMNEKDKK